jgi:serine protease Do
MLPNMLDTKNRLILWARCLGIILYAVFVWDPHALSTEKNFGTTKGFADIVGPLTNVVVNISTSSTPKCATPIPLEDGYQPFESIDDFFLDLPRKNLSKRVNSLGSGIIIDPEGLIVTNYHVVRNAHENNGKIRVIFNTGKEYRAHVVGLDSRSDIALLKITSKKNEHFPYVRWNKKENIRVGDIVFAIGNPYGLNSTVTQGIVSAVKRGINTIEEGPTHVSDWIQTDAAVNIGNSGGGLFNMDGELVGLTTTILSSHGGNIGIAFAIPSNLVRWVVEQLRTQGKVRRGWLGVDVVDLDWEKSESVGLKASMKGAAVSKIISNSPAAQAGIRVGDIILKINELFIENARHLQKIITQLPIDRPFTLTLWRDNQSGQGKEHKLSVILRAIQDGNSKMGSIFAEKGRHSFKESIKILGLTLRSTQDPSLYNRSSGHYKIRGVLIEAVDPDKAVADKIQKGDIILQVGQMAVEEPKHVVHAIKALKQIGRPSALVLVHRQSTQMFVSLPLDEE